MNKSASLFAVGVLVGSVLASGAFAWLGRHGKQTAPGATAARVLRVAHGLPTSHPVHLGIEFMARRAAELSGGRLKLEVFPSEQLGNETQCLEQAQAGTLAITKVTCGVIGDFVSTYKLFALPYLFRDSDHMWKALTGPLAEELLEMLATKDDGAPSGLTGLCFYDAGSRNFYAKTPIRSPKDLAGKKIRVLPDQVAKDTMEAMGGTATPIAWGELYTALQQGVVDGAENNPPSLLASRHYEVCKYFTLDAHTRIPDILLISSKVWATLSIEEQGWLRQAAAESNVFQRKAWAESTAKALEELRKAGVQIFDDVDTEPFRQASRPILEKYSQGKIKELVRRIEEMR